MQKYITVPAPESIISHFGMFISMNNGFIAGGALRHVFKKAIDHLHKMNEEINISTINKTFETVTFINDVKDVDIFFHSQEDFDNALKSFSTVFASEIETLYKTDNSIGISISWDTPVLDLVRRNFGTVDEILNNFDFTITQCALYRKEKEYFLTFSEDFLNDLTNSNLRYSHDAQNKKVQPYNPIERAMRYIRYGYTVDDQTAMQVIACTLDLYPEFSKIKYDQEALKRLYSPKLSSQKGLQDTLYEIRNSKTNLGSFSNGYSFERTAVRRIYQEAVDPDFNGDSYFKKYSEKYDFEYELPCSSLNNIALEKDDDSLSSSQSKDIKQSKNIDLITYNLLNFLETKEEVIGKDNLKILTHFLFTYDFTVDEKFDNIYCNVCSNSFHDCPYGEKILSRSKEAVLQGHPVKKDLFDKLVVQKRFSKSANTERKLIKLKKFSENSIEVVYKAFMKNENNDSWAYDTAQFFIEYFYSANDMNMTLRNWHDFIDNDLFDPSIPPSLVLNLVA